MDVGAGREVGKEVGGECNSKSVAHGVDEDVRDEEGEGFVGEEDAAYGLAEEGEVRPGRGKDVMSLGQVDEVQGTCLESDIEAFLDCLDGRGLLDLMVAGIHGADGLGILLLRCGYGSPQYPFTTASSIARQVNMATTTEPGGAPDLPEGVEEANDAGPCFST